MTSLPSSKRTKRTNVSGQEAQNERPSHRPFGDATSLGKIGIWRIKDDGRLVHLGTIGGLEPAPATEPSAYFTHTGRSAAGIAAY